MLLSWFRKSFSRNLYWACSIDATYEFVWYENLMTFDYITIKHLRHCKRIRNAKSCDGKYTQRMHGYGAEATEAGYCFVAKCFALQKQKKEQ